MHITTKYIHSLFVCLVREKNTWENEKRQSAAVFCHAVFSNFFFPWDSLTRVNPLSPPPKKNWFLRVWWTRLLKTLWEKEKLLVTSNFSFSHSVFYPFGELSAIFIKFEIVVCKLFQFGRVSNLLFGEVLIVYLSLTTLIMM